MTDDTTAELDRLAAAARAPRAAAVAGIAFLWFIGVIRDHLGDREDRFFATVFLGSGLLFVAMLFICGGIIATLAWFTARMDPSTWTCGGPVAVSCSPS
jgi:hypothetical protein